MLKRIPRRNHITPVLRELHWLRIQDRIIFKIIYEPEGVLVEAYKGTRRKHSIKFKQIGHTSQYGQSFFLKTISARNGLAFTEAPSLAVFRSNFI